MTSFTVIEGPPDFNLTVLPTDVLILYSVFDFIVSLFIEHWIAIKFNRIVVSNEREPLYDQSISTMMGNPKLFVDKTLVL